MDVLRACVIDFGTKWDQHFALTEFAYTNMYHSSIRMAPFEALYDQRYRSPIRWFDCLAMESMSVDMLGDDLEWVRLIQSRLVTTEIFQKSYADRWI